MMIDIDGETMTKEQAEMVLARRLDKYLWTLAVLDEDGLPVGHKVTVALEEE